MLEGLSYAGLSLELYGEIAKANGFPDKAREAQAIFAESWREQAEPGWYMKVTAGNGAGSSRLEPISGN